MGTPPISLCDTGEVDKSITLNVFFGFPLCVVGTYPILLRKHRKRR